MGRDGRRARSPGGAGRGRGGERGSALLAAVLVLAALSLGALALVGVLTVRAAAERRQADRLAALQVARAGAVRALADLEADLLAGRPAGSSLPAGWVSEGTASYRLTVAAPPGQWEYVVTSTGRVGEAEAVLEARASRPPDARAGLLAWGSATLSHVALAAAGFTLNGGLLAGGSISVAESSPLASSLTLNGDLSAAGDIALAQQGLLSSLTVNGRATANGRVTRSGTVTVRDGVCDGSTGCAAAVSLPPFPVLTAAPYEDLVALRAPAAEAPPAAYAGLTVRKDTRFTGDVTVTGDLTVEKGVLAVVDGNLTVGGTLRVDGLLYVRGGGSSPGDATVATLLAPSLAGEGSLVAAGDITATEVNLAYAGGGPAPALAVLAVSKGAGDSRDSLTVDRLTLLGGFQPTRLLLYAGPAGDLRLALGNDLLQGDTRVCAVAGRDLTVQAQSVALAGFSLTCDPDIWLAAPAPLRAAARVTPLYWRQVR